MNTWTCTRQGELYHHGIKGQKWGVRRFQNKDGSLTPAGRRRYDEPNIGRKTSESVTIDGQSFKVYGRNNKQYADKVAKKAKDMGATVSRESKTKEAKKYKIPENKSLHRLKLEEKYMKNGMTREEAEQAAAKRIRTEKFVSAAAVVTVASAVAYAKHKGYTSDKVFKADTEFQRIMRLPENAVIRKDNRQYLAINKMDKIKYKGLLGDTLNKNAKSESKITDTIRDRIYDVTVKNKGDINVASRKRSEDAFIKLFKEDSEFRNNLRERAKEVNDAMGLLSPFGKRLGDTSRLSDRDIRRKAYDYFNVLLVDTDERSVKNANKFYDALRKQGMNAIIDINDKKYSGYNTKAPIITFGGDFEYSKRVMSDTEIANCHKKAMGAVVTPSVLKVGAFYAGVFAAKHIGGKELMNRKVQEYKREHPDSELSDKEIEELLTKGGEKSK